MLGMANPSAMSGVSFGDSFDGRQGVSFGPSPAPPVQPVGGDPRQFQYRTAWNAPSQPFEGRVAPSVLREIADMDWIVRKAIEVRKDEMASLTYDIVSRDRNVTKARQVLRARAGKIAEIQQFFMRPDRRHTFRAWIGMIMEDLLVLDAVSIFKQRNSDPDAGPLAGSQVSSYAPVKLGQLLSLDPIDGSLIKVLVDDSGRIPLPPFPAYQQYYYGVPRKPFTAQQLIYAPKTYRTNRYYGFSPVEYFLHMISVNLNFWLSQGARWTDGNLPEGVVETPQGWTTPQIVEYRDMWDSVLAGDPKALRKLQFVPNGMKYTQLKSDDFDENFANFMVATLCIAMDVTPMQMGYEPTHGGLGGKGLGETMQDIQQSRSLQPTSKWLFEDVLNPILAEEFDAPDLEWSIREMDQQDDLTAAQALVAQMNAGLISVDQAIEQMGGDPIGAGRYAVLGSVTLGEPDLIKLTTQGAASIGLISPPGTLGAVPGEMAENPEASETAKPAPPPAADAAKPTNETAPSPDSHANASEAQDDRESDISASKALDLLKSPQTPALAATHRPLGTHGLWGDKLEQLPAYIQNIAHALIRSGHGESEAIQLAVGAVQRWASGGDKVSPEVRSAAAGAVEEWERLRAEHDGGHADKKVAEEDLAKWQVKAMRAVKQGKPAAVRFDSDAIPEDVVEGVRHRLVTAATPDEVKAAFAESSLRRDVLERLEAQIGAEIALRA